MSTEPSIEATFRADRPLLEDVPSAGETMVTLEEPASYEEVGVTSDTETHRFDIPVVAIECKTYLDKTMLEGASRAAEELKGRNPNALYIVVAEWLKLGSDVNLRKYKVDQIYVMRQQRNTDREYRYQATYLKNPISSEVVWHLYTLVRQHLTRKWEGDLEHGLQRGWLI